MFALRSNLAAWNSIILGAGLELSVKRVGKAQRSESGPNMMVIDKEAGGGEEGRVCLAQGLALIGLCAMHKAKLAFCAYHLPHSYTLPLIIHLVTNNFIYIHFLMLNVQVSLLIHLPIACPLRLTLCLLGTHITASLI